MRATSLCLLLTGLALLLTATVFAKEDADEIKVEIRGTLKAGVVAIGGETTGLVITSGKTTWELDLGNQAELLKQAEAVNGKRALVTGLYLPRPGVEVKVRHIVKVASIQAIEKQ